MPTELFWFVCNDSNVLPVTNEVLSLIVALAALLLFRVEYNLSAVVSGIPVFLSGKISELFFIGVTTRQRFIIGWEKIHKAEMIQSTVKEFVQIQDSSLTWDESAVV